MPDDVTVHSPTIIATSWRHETVAAHALRFTLRRMVFFHQLSNVSHFMKIREDVFIQDR